MITGGGDIHYKSQEIVLQCVINYIKLLHYLHSVANHYNGLDSGINQDTLIIIYKSPPIAKKGCGLPLL